MNYFIICLIFYFNSTITGFDSTYVKNLSSHVEDEDVLEGVEMISKMVEDV